MSGTAGKAGTGSRSAKTKGATKGGKEFIGAPIILAGAHRMPFTSAVRAGDWVFLSGVTAIDENGAFTIVGIEAQTRRVLDTIRNVLAEAGCEMSDVVKATVWLDDPRDFWNFNRVYAEYFPENPPARSCVQSRLMLDGKVEIEVLAYRPKD